FTKGNLLNNNIGATSPSGVVADNATVFQDGNTLNAYPPSDYRISGLPRHSFSVYGSYQWPSGFGVRADLRGRSSWLYNTGGVVVVPSSYTANVSVFYTQERWTTTIDFLNVTNQRTFGPSEANDTIIPGEPFAIQTRLSLRF